MSECGVFAGLNLAKMKAWELGALLLCAGMVETVHYLGRTNCGGPSRGVVPR